MKKIEKSIDLGGRKLTLSTGQIAEQASSAVMATYGETVVLATVVASEPKQDFGYFPLFVEYQKRLYAGGRIKGSRWVKRDGRPSDDDILVARLIDRSIRPLFPKTYKKEVQVIVAVLSVDLESTPDMVAGVAVSAALASSSIPWNGPVAMLKAGLKDGKLIVNPVSSNLKSSEMELVVSLTKDAIVMIEANSNEVPEEKMLEGIKFIQKESKKVITLIDDFAKTVGRKKEVLAKEKKNITLEKKINKLVGDKIKDLIINMSTMKAGYSDLNEMKDAVVDSVSEEEKEESSEIFQELFSAEVKKMILAGKRPDGRKPEEIRKLSAEVGILPRTHGSAIFNRGQTQALSVATLGSSSLEQLIESAEGEEVKRYIHHYSMPPYSVGETGRIGFPSRREWMRVFL
jgi:polyribonucleotide nucleotidyltransferase